jgi:hypothetical protein
VEDLRQPGLLQALEELFFLVGIGKEVLDAVKARLRRGVETIQKVDLTKHHREVRGQLHHRSFSSLACGRSQTP